MNCGPLQFNPEKNTRRQLEQVQGSEGERQDDGAMCCRHADCNVVHLILFFTLEFSEIKHSVLCVLVFCEK